MSWYDIFDAGVCKVMELALDGIGGHTCSLAGFSEVCLIDRHAVFALCGFGLNLPRRQNTHDALVLGLERLPDLCRLHPRAYGADSEADGASEPVRPQAAARKRDADLAVEVGSVEVSYVLPPAVAAEDERLLSTGAGGARRWAPRLVVAHRDGVIMLVSLRFEHVARGKDRDERWACTALRAEAR
ncbi:unnamed protein product [Prorocentrum cordatum]|uniref:Uncharacterized protein n=1 Tax=Prorocentrum cordatum TaxID=2364126 RepID=A0ABN9T5P5_9DINO|nr:unnamed protein product [Polarella glacialis]